MLYDMSQTNFMEIKEIIEGLIDDIELNDLLYVTEEESSKEEEEEEDDDDNKEEDNRYDFLLRHY